jgi:beta-lactamase class A
MQFSCFKPSFFSALLSLLVASFNPVPSQAQRAPSFAPLAKLETSLDGVRIGVFARNTQNNQHIEYRADEHFPMQSTFKVMAVSALLKKSMSNNQLLDQQVKVAKKDLVFWSPISEKHRSDPMTYSQLCSAALMYSDNTATNLIVNQLGGPKALNAFARLIGDTAFDISHWEPNLNSNPNRLQDSSTPKAMAESLEKLMLKSALAPAQKEQLLTWMKANTTGDARIRAGVPKGWVVADKTGSSAQYAIANDVGVIWPGKCAPIVMAIYSVHHKKKAAIADELIATITRTVIKEFEKTDHCLRHLEQ